MVIDDLYALRIPEIQEAFLRAMQGAVDRAILDEMIAAIEANDFERLYAASGFTPAVLSQVLDRIEQVYKDTADITFGQWPRRITGVSGNILIPIFNPRNPAVEQDLRTASSNFITRIENDARESIRTVLQDGISRGDNPRRTALDIVGRINTQTRQREGGVIGLTPNQTRWTLNARTYLDTLDNKYFTLTMRDKRFDSTVKTAIENGKPLPAETVSKLVTAYKNRALKYRAETISRTETIQSINRANFQAHEQGIADGLFTRDQVSKWWDDAGDGRTRTTHLLLGRQYSRTNGIPLDQPFVSVSGSRFMYSGDTSLGADASEIVQCRCVTRYRVRFINV